MKIATFNVNGITSRLPRLLDWLGKESPDVVCLQELKALDEGFPIAAIREAGYGAIWQGQRSWNGVAILAKGEDPVESRRGLPGDPDDTHSRYIEAAVQGIVIACLYLPNGNPQPGPKFDYKLKWFERLIKHAEGLYSCGHPVVLAGDFNVVPTDFDIYDPKSWRKDALLQPESRAAYERLLSQGWVDSLRHLHPEERIYTFWDYFRNHWARNAGLRIDHLLLNKELAPRLKSADVDRWVRGELKASDHAPTWIELADAGQAMPKARAATSVKSKGVKKAKAPRKALVKRKAGAGTRAAGTKGRAGAGKRAAGTKGKAGAGERAAGIKDRAGAGERAAGIKDRAGAGKRTAGAKGKSVASKRGTPKVKSARAKKPRG